MTAYTPPYRIIESDGVYAMLEIDYPDFQRGYTTMKASLVGTPDGDEILRRHVERRESTKDILRGEI